MIKCLFYSSFITVPEFIEGQFTKFQRFFYVLFYFTKFHIFPNEC